MNKVAWARSRIKGFRCFILLFVASPGFNLVQTEIGDNERGKGRVGWTNVGSRAYIGNRDRRDGDTLVHRQKMLMDEGPPRNAERPSGEAVFALLFHKACMDGVGAVLFRGHQNIAAGGKLGDVQIAHLRTVHHKVACNV